MRGRGWLPVLAVVGASEATPEERDAARRVGELAARRGWVVLTGGGPGVMEAASRGAAEAGGLTVGVLPGAGPGDEYPNPWVRVAIFTGLGSARNVTNVFSADLVVAVGGRAGTLSEVAHAVKAGREVWWLWPWRLEPPPGHPAPPVRRYHEPGPLLEDLERRLSGG